MALHANAMIRTPTLSEVPVISVVMAAYNAERTIGDSIRSVLAQTHATFELLICDDASTDDTRHIVEGFSDPRVTLIKLGRNCGPGTARDHALQAARGTWATMIDADDQFSPERLETLLHAAEAYPNDLIADGIMDCHDSKDGLAPWSVVWGKKYPYSGEKPLHTIALADFLAEERPLIHPFFRLDLARQLNASHGTKRNGEDMAFLFPFFAHGAVIRYVPKPMYLYRMTPGSLSTSNPARHRVYREVFEEGRAMFANDPSALSAIDRKIGTLHRLETYQAFFSSVRARSLSSALHVFLKHPWVAKEFFSRVAKRLPFHVHRIMHGGRGRRVE